MTVVVSDILNGIVNEVTENDVINAQMKCNNYLGSLLEQNMSAEELDAARDQCVVEELETSKDFVQNHSVQPAKDKKATLVSY